jgi:hypothetical protein
VTLIGVWECQAAWGDERSLVTGGIPRVVAACGGSFHVRNGDAHVCFHSLRVVQDDAFAARLCNEFWGTVKTPIAGESQRCDAT